MAIPGLKPYEANNYDLSLEYYGNGMTLVSIGVFRKDIDNAIYHNTKRSNIKRFIL